MVNYKEILRLAAEGQSQRQIAASMGSSRNTISEVLITAQAQGIAWPLEESVSNEQIGGILFPERYSTVSMYLEPDYAYIHSELAKRGVTLTLLWNEYVQEAESLVYDHAVWRQIPHVGKDHKGHDADSAQARRRYAG